MVDLVAAGPFRTFTLHNRDHATKLLHLTEHVVPPETLEALSVLECTLIVYAAFLHDMGMAITNTERDAILKSKEYQETLGAWPSVRDALHHARTALAAAPELEKPPIEALIYQLHESAITAYLRPRHATPLRYSELIEHLRRTSGRFDLFMFKGVSFEESLVEICVSHNLDASCLIESRTAYEDRFPRDLTIAHEQANTQFCAALLRLTDILDFDRERTPVILFESLGLPNSDLPGAEVSIREWEKHMAVHTLDVRPNEIVITAVCKHPAIERAIRDFCEIIEREIKDTSAVLNRNSVDTQTKYRVNLPLSVRPRITSAGYTYRDIALRLNQSAIISMLMGENLYVNSSVAIRELLQNSLDACAVRTRLEQGATYVPQIEVSAVTDSANRTWIEVSDNGIGMDDHVIAEYFLKLGDSYYDSEEFKYQFERLQESADPFRAISMFGVGILSVFMLADVLEVHTKSGYSPRGDLESRVVRVERLGGLAFIAPSTRTSVGATVRIRLRSELTPTEVFAEVSHYLRFLLIRPWFLIRISLGADPTFYLPTPSGNFWNVPTDTIERLRTDGFHLLPINLSRWSANLKGVVVVVFAVDSRGRLSTRRNGIELRIHENPKMGALDPKTVIPNFVGNRLSVNGFRLQSFRTRRLLSLEDGTRLPFLIDLDVKSGNAVEYDVSRERLTKKGERHLRDEINRSVRNALTQTGTIENMAPDLSILLLARSHRYGKSQTSIERDIDAPNALQKLFADVQEEIPKDCWPKGMHHQLATKLGITPSLASKVINWLLDGKMISNPNQDSNGKPV